MRKWPIKAAWISELDVVYVYDETEDQMLLGMNSSLDYIWYNKIQDKYVMFDRYERRPQYRIEYLYLEDFFSIAEFIHSEGRWLNKRRGKKTSEGED